MITAILPTTRLCRGPCARELPIECFRLNRKGKPWREYWCRDCHNKAEKERNKRRGDKALQRFARSAHFQHLDRRLRALAITTLKKLGGVERMSTRWVAALKAAEAQNPGASFIADSYSSILRLFMFVWSKPDLAPTEPEQMTDEELAQVHAWELAEFIQSHPDVAVAAAKTLGWTVVPGDGLPGGLASF
jgi:hypothetical protein